MNNSSIKPAIATLALAATALLIFAASSATAGPLGVVGAGLSGMQIVNAGDGPMSGTVRLWPQNTSAAPIDIAISGVPTGGAHNMFLPAEAAVPNGVYASVSTTDQPSRSLAQTSWVASGGATLYTAPDPAFDVIAPYVAKDYEGMSSVVSIQNTDDAEPASVTVSLTAADAATPAASAEYTIPPGRSITLALSTELPFAEIIEDGFVGAMRVTSADAPIAVHALTDVYVGTLGVFDAEGLPAGSGAETLHVPRFYIDAPAHSGVGTLQTFVAVANPGTSPVDVHIDYASTDASCVGSTDTRTIPADSMTLFDDVADSGLGAGCSGFSTIRSSGGGVLATVILRQVEGSTATAHAAHRAVSFADASEVVHVPTVRNKHVPPLELTTEFVLTNPNAMTATIEIARFDAAGDPITTECSACESFGVPPGVSEIVTAAMLEWPEGTFGSIRIDADVPVAATVFDIALGGGYDTGAYTGVIADDGPAPRYHPILLKGESVAVPTPPPSPTPTDGPAPSATPVASVPAPPTAGPTPTPGPSGSVRGMVGAGASGIVFVNRDPAETANLIAVFRRQGGGEEVEVNVAGVPPWRAANHYLPASKDLANGVHSVIAQSDRSLGAIVRTDWFSSGASILSAPAAAAPEVAVPYVVKAHDQRTSYVTVQNTDTAVAADVEITIHNPDGSIADTTTVTVAPGESITLRLSDETRFGELPASFVGSLMASAEVPIAAHAMVEDSGGAPRGVFDAPAMAVELADDTLAVPSFSLAESKGYGERSTWVAVLNPGSSSVEATVSYAGERGTCVGDTATHAPVTLPPGGMSVFRPNDAEPALPAGCSGSAIVHASGGYVNALVVHDLTDSSGRWSAAHPALPEAESSTDWFVPIFRNRHLSGFEISTEVGVQNLGDGPANVTLLVLDASGAPITDCAACTATIPAGTAHRFDADEVGALAVGEYGSALVESDAPVVVVLREFSGTGAMDAIASASIPLWADGAPVVVLPLTLRGGSLDLDPPPPPPSPTPTPPPVTYEVVVRGYVDVSGSTAHSGDDRADKRSASRGEHGARGEDTALDVTDSANASLRDHGVAQDDTCPACDLVYDDADREAALTSPLPPLEFVVLNARGEVLGRGTSAVVDGVQVATIEVTSSDERIFVELAGTPDGWIHCPNEPLRQRAAANGPDARLVEAGYHFSNTCVPVLRGTTIHLPFAEVGRW